jgi:zinc transporter, ZIP family
MLPSSKKSFQEGGMSERAASWAFICLFVIGAIGIQTLSRVMHHFLPSHIVDCDHTHDEEDQAAEELAACVEDEESFPVQPESHSQHTQPVQDWVHKPALHLTYSRGSENLERVNSATWKNYLTTSKTSCDEIGPCYGYSEPCGVDCFRTAHARNEHAINSRPFLPRPMTTPAIYQTEQTPLLSTSLTSSSSSSSASTTKPNGLRHTHSHAHNPSDLNAQSHHHHVPTNAFLSLGLQTSIAIALHKLPEGFITYATNHANPRLGVAIFVSLFIHNFTEGFALALPLYLALQSRAKAMLWAAVLGGLSQPLGAAVAALWFHVADNANHAPGETVYGVMFAVVAGVMTMVGLQLMGESLELTHDRPQCLMWAIAGMGILGVTGALTV